MQTPLIYLYLFGLTILLLTATACQTTETTEAPATETPEIREFPVSTTSEAAMAEFEKGVSLLGYPDNVEAHAHFTKAIELDPKFAGAYLYRVYTSGSAEEGVADIEKAQGLLDNATEGERLLAALMNTWRTGDSEKRMEIAQKMVQNFPDVPRAHIVMGNQYVQKDIAKARTHWEKALQTDPNSLQAHDRIGNSYLFNEPKDYDKAAEHFQKMIEVAPDNPQGYIRLGDSYRAKNQLDQALTAYQKAAEVDPDERLNYQMMGHVNSFLGNYEEARKNYQEAVKHDPDKGAGVLRYASLVHVHEGNPAATMSELEALVNNMENMGVPASRVDQRKAAALEDMSWIAYHTRATDQLKKTYEKTKPIQSAITADIGTPEAAISQKADNLFWETLIALSEKDLKTAKAKAEQVKETLDPIKDDNKLQGYHFLQGNIALQEGNPQSAIEHLNQTGEGWVYAQYLLGKAYQQAKQPEKATAILTSLANHNFNGVQYALIRNELQDLTKP